MSKILMISAAFAGLILSELPVQAGSTHVEEESEGRLRSWVSHRLAKEELRNIVLAAKYLRIYEANALANANEATVKSFASSKKRYPPLRDVRKPEYRIRTQRADIAPHSTDDELRNHLLHYMAGQLN